MDILYVIFFIVLLLMFANDDWSTGTPSPKGLGRYCRECGYKHDADAKFCRRCGALREEYVKGGKS